MKVCEKKNKSQRWRRNTRRRTRGKKVTYEDRCRGLRLPRNTAWPHRHCHRNSHPDDDGIIVSSSRDNSLIVWRLTKGDSNSYGVLHRRLTGHSHFVSDVALSSDADFAVSGSGTSPPDVLSVALVNDSVIVSGSRDHTIKVWNTCGTCMSMVDNGGGDSPTDWVSCVRFIPDAAAALRVMSASWDGSVRVWDVDETRTWMWTAAVAPGASLAASGGKDGVVQLWDMAGGVKIYEFEVCSVVHAYGLCICPNRYWMCIVTDERIRVWDLESKDIIKDLNVIHNNKDNNYINGGTEITTDKQVGL
ncbi:hypothetical protein JHK85_026080 [Glycine max]|nr:hypothetical protein JHK85_026080 [Glycine max]